MADPDATATMTNAVRNSHNLDHRMMICHRQKTKEAREESESIAELQIANGDLPLVYRARAYMVLGCSSRPGYVEWAQEAVRITQLGIDYIEGPAGPAELSLLESCQRVLQKARDDYTRGGGYGVDDSDADDMDVDTVEETETGAVEESSKQATPKVDVLQAAAPKEGGTS